MRDLQPTSYSWAKTKNFPTRIRNKTRLSTLTTSIPHSVGSPSHSNEAKKEIKGIQIGKKERKLSLFADDLIVYIENPIDSTKKLFDLINEFGKTTGYKVNIQKSKAFLYTNNEIQKQKSGGKKPICYGNKENKVPQNNPNQGGKRPVLRKLHNNEERNQGRHKQMEAYTMFIDWKS